MTKSIIKERDITLKKFARNFHKQVKEDTRNFESLSKDLDDISVHFQPTLKGEQKDYEDLLGDILSGKSEKATEGSFSEDWFNAYLGRFVGVENNIEFVVKDIQDSFRRGLLSSFHLPYNPDSLNSIMREHFDYANDENKMSWLLNDLLRKVIENRPGNSIDILIHVTRDMAGPTRLTPQLIFTNYTMMSLGDVLYVNPPQGAKKGTATINLFHYYRMNNPRQKGLTIATLNQKKKMSAFEYNVPNFLGFFTLTRGLEMYIHKKRRKQQAG